MFSKQTVASLRRHTDLRGIAAARIEVPAQLVASTVHRGPYDELASAYHTLTGRIAEHGHQAAGPPRELYLNDPGEVPPEELLTEVQWPIESEMSR